MENNNDHNKITKLDPVIRNSLEAYDRHQFKIKNFISKVKFVKFIENNNSTNQIIFFDKNKKKLFESSYEVMGIYLPQNNMWKWAWSIPSFPNKHTFMSRKILEYAFNLDPVKEYMLRSELINSKISVINDIQLDIHVALSSYISKNPFIFRWYSLLPESDSDSETETETETETESNKKSRSRRKQSRQTNLEEPNANNIYYEYDLLNKKNKETLSYFLFIIDYDESLI